MRLNEHSNCEIKLMSTIEDVKRIRGPASTHTHTHTRKVIKNHGKEITFYVFREALGLVWHLSWLVYMGKN